MTLSTCFSTRSSHAQTQLSKVTEHGAQAVTLTPMLRLPTELKPVRQAQAMYGMVVAHMLQ